MGKTTTTANVGPTMSDDIVTRLRYYDKYLIPNAEFPTVQGDLVKAADEIERLRAQASTWRKVADRLAIAVQSQIWFSELTRTGQGALDHYEAVRGGDR